VIVDRPLSASLVIPRGAGNSSPILRGMDASEDDFG
jgi:hypothetical protein